MAHHDSRHQIRPGTRWGRRAIGAVLVLAFVLIAVLFGSLRSALVFGLALAAFVAPGVPLAGRFFSGYRAILAGCAFGYLSSSLGASLLVRLRLLSLGSMIAVSVVLFVVARVVAKRIVPKEESPVDSRELGSLVLALGFAIVLVAVPFLKVGSEVPGGVAFRAYFSADLMTHLSVVAELQKGDYPLVNPYYAGDRLGYYWLFFVFPAVLGEWTSNQGALLALYLVSGMLFSGLFFGAAREMALRSLRAFLATAVVVAAVSYEGVFALGRTFLGREPFWDTNVDAFGRWVLGLVSLDGLHRSLLYTPQHLFSYSLLVLLLWLVLRGEPRDRAGALFSGALLGGMAGTSIVTAMLAGPWLMIVVLGRVRGLRRALEIGALVTVTALALLAWYIALGFFGDAGSALSLRHPRLLELPSVLFFDAGALVALVAFRRSFRRADLELAILFAMALGAVLFLDLEGYEGVWMAWRAGSVLLLSLGFLAAPALGGRLGLWKALVLVPALATVLLDVYNAQDVSNRDVSAGEFRWTTVVSRDEWEALHWIRDHTPPDAVVQWDVRARELGEWAFLPALGQRRMAVGSPIFLLDLRKYRVRERREVRPIFTNASAEEAHRLARRLGIDYLFIGARELQVRGEGLRKLFESEALFRPVFENDGVTILKVQGG